MAVKENRIEFRVADDKKKQIEKAAQLANLSLSAYIRNVVLRQTKIDLEQNEIITLTKRDRDALMEVLANPPEPNEALKALFK